MNEARGELGLGPVPGGDQPVIITPQGPVPLSGVGVAPGPAAKPVKKLRRFNPNHYEPGPQGGQFAPAGDEGASGSSDTGSGNDSGNTQVAQEIPLFARPPVIPEDEIPEYKEPIPNLSNKEGAKDIPSWARGKVPKIGQNGKDFAGQLMDEEYGPGNWSKTDPEYKQLQKYGNRSFRDPKSIVLPGDDGT